ncbi:uncharacterized protein I303_106519 [Kwoniella dejecticola CBS 10117]|uniref:Uncharacterized protein n=1 Tax=Kwoniella dejecticola CBS 10117 TaxID=1296121 RepID=A0A1A5ZUG9_9TREE|nr:uncharacterized protein I303_08223 [Kwoniella dejecticola CBS 10117]OBR81453.1 hypothetical protein I303_08223 [Kwoniella dejecticola CBS 10117]
MVPSGGGKSRHGDSDWSTSFSPSGSSSSALSHDDTDEINLDMVGLSISSLADPELTRDKNNQPTSNLSKSESQHAHEPMLSTTKGKNTPGPSWEISPHQLKLSSCTCSNGRKELKTSEEYLQYNLRRFERLLKRLSESQSQPKAVSGNVMNLDLKLNYVGRRKTVEMVELSIRLLRDRGHELFHFLGRHLSPDESGSKRNEISIFFANPSSSPRSSSTSSAEAVEAAGPKVSPAQIPGPSPDAKSNTQSKSSAHAIPNSGDTKLGHRILSEILIHVRPNSTIENVAMRLMEDPQDWLLLQPYTYLSSPAPHEKLQMDIPDKRQNIPWDGVMNMLLTKIRTLKPRLNIEARKIDQVLLGRAWS